MNTTTKIAGLSTLFAVGCVTLATGCGTENTNDSQIEEEFASGVEVALTSMPTSTLCLRITATPSSGATIVKTFSLASGASTASVQWGTMNSGSYTFNSDAFSVACSSIGGTAGDWIADPAPVTVRAGVATLVTLTYRKNSVVQATANFVDTVKGIAAGYYGTAFATDTGVLEFDGYSQLFQRKSYSPFDSTSTPGNAIASITATVRGYCAARVDGTVWCWGSNVAGELGSGIAIGNLSYTPVQVSGVSNAKLISSGGRHTCAAMGGTSAGVVCWGSNSDGQLGNGTTADSTSPVRAYSNNVRSLAANRASTYIVTYASTPMAWGANSYGQLGNGTTSSTRTPTTILTGAPVQQVVAGDVHACAVATDGSASCWGSNSYGQLGDGTTTDRSMPTAVAGLSVKQMTAGQGQTCAVTTGNLIYCWGTGGYGQVGDGTGKQQPLPTQVKAAGVTFTMVGSGALANNNCALAANFDVYCWGTGSTGVGDGTPNMAFVPVKVVLP